MKHLIVLGIMIISVIGSAGPPTNQPYLLILGIAQDGGYPHIGCERDCCSRYWKGESERRHPTSFALVDPVTHQKWLFEATPDITHQLHKLEEMVPGGELIDGIFLTHGHIGHYTGLMHLGKESLNSKNIPVYAMPRMKEYLTNNGPWSQLVNDKNIVLRPLMADSTINLNDRLAVTPFLVPHRDEFTETVGYHIAGLARSIIFIPDIDKWEKWNRDIKDMILDCNVALLDGSFYDGTELPHRDMNEIPHPFIVESLESFKTMQYPDKQKIHFIHFNHTNPLLNKNDPKYKKLIDDGYNIAAEGQILKL